MTVRSTSSLDTPGSSARTTYSEPLSIRSTRGSRTGASDPVHRARGPPQNRSSKVRRKPSNHRSMSSNQSKGDGVVLARLVSRVAAVLLFLRSMVIQLQGILGLIMCIQFYINNLLKDGNKFVLPCTVHCGRP